MKKSTKIILPALAVLVLGTAAAATGTVAWFAANGVVEAKGMQVKCATSKNLLISNIDPAKSSAAQFKENETYGSVVNSSKNSIVELSPSSTTSTALKTASITDGFYYVDTNISSVSGSVLKDATVKKGSETLKRYVEHDFWLANSATANMDLVIQSLTVTDTTKDGDGEVNAAITQALRIGVVYEDNTKTSDKVWSKIYYVAKSATDTSTTKVYQAFTDEGVVDHVSTGASDKYTTAASEGVAAKDLSDQTTAYYSPSLIDLESTKSDSMGQILSTTGAAEDATKYSWSAVRIFVWYEGQDAACTSNNALTVEDLSISITFRADEASK